MKQLIVFTDLDGTLLNHHDYAYEAVLPTLEKLKKLNIPVILNSSKTLSELEKWQSLLKLAPPVIAENGGVLLLENSTGEVDKILIGKPYAEIRHVLSYLREEFGWKFEGFGDWSVGDVMNHTGLKVSEAVLAKEREVTEPILWQDSEENRVLFEQKLAEEDLKLVKGGRFLHVMGHHDKADAMHFLVNRAYFSCGQDCNIIALGDSQNDVAMLDYAHQAIVLPDSSGQYLSIESALYCQSPAPLGWVNAIEKILAKDGESRNE